MFQVKGVLGFSVASGEMNPSILKEVISTQRAGLMHGTKVATISGWKRVEAVEAGELVRTVDHGFCKVQIAISDHIAMPGGNLHDDYLPVRLPARAGFNKNPVWVLPEQYLVVNQGGLESSGEDIAVVPARMLNGTFGITAQSPDMNFQVRSLCFEFDEVVYIEGGFQAFCKGRDNSHHRRSPWDAKIYFRPNEQEALELIREVSVKDQFSAIANRLAALPAPIAQGPVTPVHPKSGRRREGRPGRPSHNALLLRPEWQT